ncbi:MAG: hypothetical protein IKJ82_05150 [Oscillospiraceae bacterium]|nr:hypothetical protein [Oscillospiraceae bacterium]
MLLQKLREFMYGRNGTDMFSFALIIAGFVINILYVLSDFRPLYILSLAAYGYALFRTLSKNIPARQKENRKFMEFWWKIKNRWVGFRADFEERKTYKHFKCPSCGQKIRIPRGRGKVEICCPKCSNRFVKKV